MKISVLIGKKINELMDKNNLSLRKLSEEIGVTHPTLKSYIDGEKTIDSEKLLKVAKLFNKPFDYFFKEENQEFNFMFRSDLVINNIDYIEQALIDYNDIMSDCIYNYVPQKYTLKYNLEKKSILSTVKRIAYEQRKCLNIENVIPDNYFSILSNIGINVIVKDLNNNNIFGVSTLSSDLGSYIIINDSKEIPEERKIFSLFHEYAHLLFHSNEFKSKDESSSTHSLKSELNEKIADTFAGHFLMPSYLVDSYISNKKEIDIFDIKRYFKVSLQTAVLMLKEYNKISNEDYRDFWRKINANGLRKVEIDPIIYIDYKTKNEKLISKIKELYLNEEISSNKVSEVLGLNIIDTRVLLKEWRSIDERYLPIK